MKLDVSLAAAAVAGLLLAVQGALAFGADELNPQQQRMRTCNTKAEQKGLTDGERNHFMRSCLKGRNGNGHKLTAREQRAKERRLDAEDPFVKRGYEAGGIDYFSKPFDPDILRMKIAVYASYRLHDEVLKAREKSVRESEELLRVGKKLSLLLEGLPIGVLISASPLRGLDGRIVGAVVLVQDLTESKKVIEQELERRVTNLISLGVELEESVSR